MNRLFLLFLLLTLCLAGCKKEITETLHENAIVDSNQAPPYKGVTTLQIENYVNKLYIDLQGREPSEQELNAHVSILKQQQLSEAARDIVIEDLLDDDAYHQRFFEINSANMLEGLDSTLIQQELDIFLYVQQLTLQNGDTLQAQLIQLEINKIQYLLGARDAFKAGNISINTYFSYFINNYFYDQINMGSENFVKGTFENLFYRFPTAAELASGKNMFDGAPSDLFLVDGNSKGDLVHIVTHCNEFYQGLIILAFQTFLVRQPSSIEMGTLAQALKNNNDYGEIQKNILRSKEYAGF